MVEDPFREQPDREAAMNLNQIFIGIDCGLDGALARIDGQGHMLQLDRMPTIKKGKGRKIDVAELAQSLELAKYALGLDAHRKPVARLTVVIEDPGGHAPSAAGLRSMTYSFAVTEAVCVIGRIRYELVMARKWQSEYWSRPKMPKGQKFDTKAAALQSACKLWPAQDWTHSERAQKPHEGFVDAALIAEWGRRKLA